MDISPPPLQQDPPPPPNNSTVLSSQQILLPPRFEDAAASDLMELIADMIDRLIAHNDQIPLQTEALTRFHSRLPPSISVLDYLARIVKYANIERSCLLITLHYIDQICTRLPKFTITSLTVHRFIIASITVSSKALCDVFCTNTHYAKVGGIRTNELNMLEREFLAIIDWRLFCTRELLQRYYVNLARTHSKGLFKVAPESLTLSVPTAVDLAEETEDEDSTAHGTPVCGTTTEDDGMRSDSDSSDDEEDRDKIMLVASAPPGPGPPSSSSSKQTPSISASASPEIITPRTAAKRRAEEAAEDSSRPKGRRRLND